jgi:hypothetical protein
VEKVALAAATEVGENLAGIPAFMFWDTMITGYNIPEGVGAEIVAELGACRDMYAARSSSTGTSPPTASRERSDHALPSLGRSPGEVCERSEVGGALLQVLPIR